MSDSTKDNGEQLDFSSEDLIERIRMALKRDGDFPASAKIVTELRALTSDPKTKGSQLAELILREPSLGTRVLHLVNSSFYRRARPIMTVSQAVVQIGMKPLADLCAGLVLMQKFVPAARRAGSFANCLRKTVVTSLLSSALTSAIGSTTASRSDEYGYLAGSFAELGILLLAFYFPQLYESAVKRAESRGIPLEKAIHDLTGIRPLQLSIEIIDALELPAFYREILKAVDGVSSGTGGANESGEDLPHLKRVASALSVSTKFSDIIVNNRGKSSLDLVIKDSLSKYTLDETILNNVIGDLPGTFRDHCASLDLQLPALPEFLASYGDTPETQSTEAPTGKTNSDADRFAQFITELRAAVENREPTASIITTVMETFAWSLRFDRVLLLLVENTKTKMVGRLMLGSVNSLDPKKIVRSLSAGGSGAADFRAFKEGKCIFSGEALLPGGAPIAVIPIGMGKRAIGVVYADRIFAEIAPELRELSVQEQQAIATLAEILDASVAQQ